MSRPSIAVRPLVGLLGVLLATMASEFNDSVVSAALGDLRGALGIGYDAGTWIDSLFTSGLACGMALAPWSAVTFTLRRFTFFAIALATGATVLIPFAPNLGVLLALRALQGLAAGLTIPLLMTTALRVLPPPIRLYGLAVYALTATFTTPVSTSLTALWTDVTVTWQLVFLAAIPVAALAAALVWYGLPEDEPQYDRLKRFDWPGCLLIFAGFGSLTTLLVQGSRLDWFNSPLVIVLAGVAAAALPLLLVNEWYAALPLLQLRLALRRNFAYGIVGLFGFLVVSTSATAVPLAYLSDVQHYRPLQSFPVTLIVALAQFVMLPATAFLLDHRRVDSRAVSLIGLALMLAACLGCSKLNASWNRDQFYLWQALQAIGQPLVVMSLLMMATNTIRRHEEGPFASALINSARAIAESVGTWMVELVERWRGNLHSERIVDAMGDRWFRAVRGGGTMANHPSPLLPDGTPRTPGALGSLAARASEQAGVLTTADTFLVIAALIVVFALVVLTLPRRTYPPRIVFADHS